MSQLFLCPEIRYELKDEDKLTFADVHCVYTKSANKQQVTGFVTKYFHSHSLLMTYVPSVL